MAQTAGMRLICGDAAHNGCAAGMMLTDPPFELPGAELARIVARYDVPHLVLITTMRQLLDFHAAGGWRLNFDFVIDGVMPKLSKSVHQPNYTHQTGAYLTRAGARSAFSRKRRARSDAFEGNGYWPTIFHAPRDRTQQSGYAKNLQAVTDLLGSFDVPSVVDPFCGVGTTLLAAIELDLPATGIERDPAVFARLRQAVEFCAPCSPGWLEVIEPAGEKPEGAFA